MSQTRVSNSVGEFADVIFGNPANLRANNDTDPFDNVGKSMFGGSAEVAYHVPLGPIFGPILGSNWEADPFYRYTYQNFQTGGFAGTDFNFPTGLGVMQFHDVGFAVYPTTGTGVEAQLHEGTEFGSGRRSIRQRFGRGRFLLLTCRRQERAPGAMLVARSGQRISESCAWMVGRRSPEHIRVEKAGRRWHLCAG
jgi:hypothetical protein